MSKDPLDDILADLESDTDDDDLGIDDDDDDLKDLKAELAARDKKIAGLLKEAKTQRRKKQDTEKRLDELTSTVTNILAQKQTPAADIMTGAEKVDEIIKGDFDDDGNPIIKADALKAIRSKEVDALKEEVDTLKELLQASTQQQTAESEGQKVIQAIVGSDERFGPAYNKYQTARKWVEDKVVEYQNENKVGGLMTSGQALDYVFDDELEAEFNDSFPGMELENVVTAEDSQRHFKKALNSIATAMTPETKTDDQSQARMQKLMQKPSGLGGGPKDRKSGELDLLDRLRNMGSSDLLGISDAQEKAIMDALRKDEN